MWYGPRRREERGRRLFDYWSNRAIIYTTEMSKQITKSHVRDAVHMYSVNSIAGLTPSSLILSTVIRSLDPSSIAHIPKVLRMTSVVLALS
jgi:hypothetical protein